MYTVSARNLKEAKELGKEKVKKPRTLSRSATEGKNGV